MTESNQIRINELARELEVKARAILDYLPEADEVEVHIDPNDLRDGLSALPEVGVPSSPSSPQVFRSVEGTGCRTSVLSR